MFSKGWLGSLLDKEKALDLNILVAHAFFPSLSIIFLMNEISFKVKGHVKLHASKK